MKIAAIMHVYDEPEYLELAAEPLKNVFEKTFFFTSPKPWSGKAYDNSSTRAWVKKLCDATPNFEMIEGEWGNESDQRNFSLDYIAKLGFTHAFIIDSDEIYFESHLKNIVNFVGSHPQYATYHIQWNTYWKKTYYRIEPREVYEPLIVANVARFKFTEIRGGNTGVKDSQGMINNPDITYQGVLIPSGVAICYHLSYARCDDFIAKKISTSSHRPDMKNDWFENVWQKWTPDAKNLHPMNPTQYRQAVPEDFSSLPPQLKDFIKKEQLPTRPCDIVVIGDVFNIDQNAFSAMIKNHTRHTHEILFTNNRDAKTLNDLIKKNPTHDVCLVSSVAETSPEWLEYLYETLTNIPDCGLVGSLGLDSAGGYQKSGFVATDTAVPHLAFYATLIQREVINKIGVFDLHFKDPMAVDADFILRARLAGFSAYVSAKSAVKLNGTKYNYYTSAMPGIAAMQDMGFYTKYYNLLLTLATAQNPFANVEAARKLGLVI